MSIGEAHALGGEAVEVRRVDLAPRGIIGAYIPVAEVIGEDDYNVGRSVCGEEGNREQYIE
jgi:hypothetical protein